MEKQIIRITRIISVCLVSVLLFVSCDTSLPVNSEEGELTIRLMLPQELEVTTKGMFDDFSIADVWVLQYAKGTDALLKAGKFSGTNIGAESSGVIKVVTSGFIGVDSYFYVIANGGDNFLAMGDTLVGSGKSPISTVNLKKKTKSLDNHGVGSTFATADSIVLMQDSIIKNGNKAIIVAPLVRASARFKVQWNKTESFKGELKIKDVKVCNVPKAMAAFTRGGGSINEKYPEVSKANITDTISISASLDHATTLTFHIPENLRGMGTGTSFPEKNIPAKGPGGNLTGCTFILMSGDYKYPIADGGVAKDSIKVQYKIYPGGNLTNDYNIQRGYSYDLKVNISGANSADVRVTITDGRVAVFDDVVVMDTIKVDF